ncbi:HAD-IA family hydrolase [Marinomonas sp. 2405UD68-3]|uniref:HAD-IA family hydrolase n=1 Tax=Marinomonas sp. 2405UD68-3 TaxID=3391835 RepID=UPI0039C9AA43
MIKLVIFDWDGTLFDSIDMICQCMMKAGKDVGVAFRAANDIKDIIGLGLTEAIESVWPEESKENQTLVVERYKTLFMAGDHDSPLPYSGVLASLDTLLDKGFMMAVATGKSRRGLNRALLSTDTQKYFSATRCADETTSKPNPHMLKELLDELGVSAEEAVMVGDTEYDLMMAKNIRMPSVGVSYGAHTKDRLVKCDPVIILDDFAELIDVIEKMV